MKRLSVYIISVLLLWACTPDDENYGPRSTDANLVPDSTVSAWLYILNEGNFTWGNASVTGVDLNSYKVYQEVYKTVNNLPLGDVAQSMFMRNDTGWVVVNHSGKIEVVELPSFKRLYTISGLNSPRYMDCAGDTCYVTELYANLVRVLTTRGEMLHSLPHNGLAGEIKIVSNTVWVSTSRDSTTTVSSLNRYTGELVETIVKDAESVYFEENALYWVKNGRLSKRGHEQSNSELLTTGLPHSLSHLTIDASREEIYYVFEGSVWLADYTTPQTESISWYSEPDLNIYNLVFEEEESALYVVNVKDYTRRGEVIKLNKRGVEAGRIVTGIIPNHLTFFKK